MWVVIHADGTSITSDEHTWSEISHQEVVGGYTFDVLNDPAVEIRVQLHPSEAIHRLRSPEPVRFFHYLRARVGWDGLRSILYEAVGYCFPGGRFVLEVVPGMGISRAELGAQFSFDPVLP